jgi:hypothetical protein
MAGDEASTLMQELIDGDQPCDWSHGGGLSSNSGVPGAELLYRRLVEILGEPRGQRCRISTQYKARKGYIEPEITGERHDYHGSFRPTDVLYERLNRDAVSRTEPPFLSSGGRPGTFVFRGRGWRPTRALPVLWKPRGGGKSERQVGWYLPDGVYKKLQTLDIVDENDESPGSGKEGKAIWRWSKYIERRPDLRQRCLEACGSYCRACGDQHRADLEAIYGEVLKQILEVHHRDPLSLGQRETDPTTDLVPLCPNCHRIVHYLGEPYIKEPKRLSLDQSQPK